MERRLLMADLEIKGADECGYDAVSLGEVMTHPAPTDAPTARARAMRAWRVGVGPPW
jgi:hypothetical protein